MNTRNLKGWPFELLYGQVSPTGGEGAGPGNPY
jgi:hypothetical protein